MSYETALAKYRAAEQRLRSWDKALNDPRKFRPVIKSEWDRAFDAREKARDACQAADPARFAVDHPQFIWAQIDV